jgi:molybdopterin-guanine dinucleotide biosynthesis protein A
VEASTTAAAILAGGRAQRFNGQDKSRLVVEGRTIIVRQVEVLQRVAGEIFVVGPAPDRYADLDLPVYPDRWPGGGVLGGIYTALCATRADRVLVVACDLPFLTADLMARLAALARDRDGARVRTADGPEPLVACYRQTSRDRLRDQLTRGHLRAGDLGRILDLAEIGPEELARFGPPARLLANVNTPDEYARVQYGSL